MPIPSIRGMRIAVQTSLEMYGVCVPDLRQIAKAENKLRTGLKSG